MEAANAPLDLNTCLENSFADNNLKWNYMLRVDGTHVYKLTFQLRLQRGRRCHY